MKNVILAVLLAAGTLSAQAPAPAAPAWKPFQEFSFLVGSWSGAAESSGRVGGRSARFSQEMGGNTLVQKGSILFAAQQGIPEESTEEVAYYYYDREKRKYLAHYFFSTGVSGVYDVDFPAEGTIRLTSDALVNYEKGARSRMTIVKKSDTEIAFQLDLAPAGKDFVTFVTSKLMKK